MHKSKKQQRTRKSVQTNNNTRSSSNTARKRKSRKSNKKNRLILTCIGWFFGCFPIIYIVLDVVRFLDVPIKELIRLIANYTILYIPYAIILGTIISFTKKGSLLKHFLIAQLISGFLMVIILTFFASSIPKTNIPHLEVKELFNKIDLQTVLKYIKS
ncbi:MAG: hypothetical protein PWP27_1720 [Clostridiales bacterium]|jgi:hypothetical protein|nr:hypothetical protein [Clostridiales bacterium]MDK2933910.1 hypothetical protein [Clostridiales bacterium]